MKFQKVNFGIEVTGKLHSFLITSTKLYVNITKVKSNLLNVNIKGTTETRLLSTQIQKLCIYTTRKKKNLVYNFQFQNNKQTERELKVQRDWKSLFGYRNGFLEKLLIYDRKKYYFFTIK